MKNSFASCLFLLPTMAAAIYDHCPPLCKMYCEFGNVVDDNGCLLCKCRDPPVTIITCPLVKCASTCPNGYKVDENGCQGCECVEPVRCPVGEAFDEITNQCVAVSCEASSACAAGSRCVPANIQCVRAPCPQFQCEPLCPPVCAVFCEFGNVLDDNGCATCRCNPPPPCGVGEEYDTLTGECVVVSCDSPKACDSGETCQPVDIQCFRPPCQRFECQPASCPKGEVMIFGYCRPVTCDSPKACSRYGRCSPKARTCYTRQSYCPQYQCKTWWVWW